jgi:hypothetical protein
MTGHKKILQEDYDELNRREIFIKGIKDKFNLDFSDFSELGMIENGDVWTTWTLNNYVLEYSDNNLYFVLYKKDLPDATT